MLRSLKSAQRKVRMLAVKIATDTPTGLDSNQVTVSGLAVTFKQPFADVPIVISQSSGTDTDVEISAISATGCTVSEACSLLVIGSDVADRI